MVKDETFSRVQPLHESRGSSSRYVERRIEQARSGVSEAGGCKSAKTRPEAKSGQAAFRFPRPCRLNAGFPTFFSLLRDQLVIRQPLPGDLAAKEFEPFCIRHVFPRVVTEHLLINVAEQVKRFDANVGSLQAKLQEAPEVFHPVSMNLA